MTSIVVVMASVWIRSVRVRDKWRCWVSWPQIVLANEDSAWLPGEGGSPCRQTLTLTWSALAAREAARGNRFLASNGNQRGPSGLARPMGANASMVPGGASIGRRLSFSQKKAIPLIHTRAQRAPSGCPRKQSLASARSLLEEHGMIGEASPAANWNRPGSVSRGRGTRCSSLDAAVVVLEQRQSGLEAMTISCDHPSARLGNVDRDCSRNHDGVVLGIGFADVHKYELASKVLRSNMPSSRASVVVNGKSVKMSASKKEQAAESKSRLKGYDTQDSNLFQRLHVDPKVEGRVEAYTSRARDAARDIDGSVPPKSK
ncbi:hypothetical protein CMUS01_04623 [Colletotrichum musicola]|uniref:Uncharacterized protein n=1 Tax=Colletotrichum musicola TaxID=2175873 RepID=A0A8H6KVU3_9PEZI|nr:hypothetical protein CMUS01_04623 [Colletotrichum musicola]